MTVKKKLMELVWRLQASQTVIGIIFWPLTLTGIFYPYIRERSNNFGLGQEAVLPGMLILFALIALFILIFGLLFDKMRFWNEQNIVAFERNPYGSYKFTARDVYVVELMILALKQLPHSSKELESKISFFDKWLERVVDEDAKIQQDIKAVQEWVKKGGPRKPAQE